MTSQELQTLAKDALEKMTVTLGFPTEITIVPTDENSFKLTLASEDAGRIIGRKGQTLEALELVLNRIVKKNDENAPWVPVEIDGYSTGRTGAVPERGKDGRRPILDDETIDQLTHMALDAAKEVRHWKKAKRLGPYLPAERRIIHTTLKDDPDVTTESIPVPEEGPRMKYINVILKTQENA